MKKGNSYDYIQIDEFIMNDDYNISEYGTGFIGSSFIVLKHTCKDIVISFVLTGSNDNGFVYECIYCNI